MAIRSSMHQAGAAALTQLLHSYVNARVSLQFCVLSFRLFQDGDVGVGVFPEREEIFVGGEGASAGKVGIRSLRGSRLQGVGTSHSQMRQCSRPAVPDDAAVSRIFWNSTEKPATGYLAFINC